MKKVLSIAVAVLMVLALCSCGNSYSEEKAAIVGAKWYGEAETSNSIIVWEFFEESVCRSQYFIDGNGQHESTKNTGSYKFKSDVIEIKFEDTDYVLPYTFSNGEFVLDGGKLLSAEDVKEQIQGHWNSRESSYNPLTGFSSAEHHVEFTGNQFEIENASEAYRGAPGEYYYYGPYTGTYEIGDGCFICDDYHLASSYFFLVKDGQAVIYRYNHEYKRGGEFPRQNGYEF